MGRPGGRASGPPGPWHRPRHRAPRRREGPPWPAERFDARRLCAHGRRSCRSGCHLERGAGVGRLLLRGGLRRSTRTAGRRPSAATSWRRDPAAALDTYATCEWDTRRAARGHGGDRREHGRATGQGPGADPGGRDRPARRASVVRVAGSAGPGRDQPSPRGGARPAGRGPPDALRSAAAGPPHRLSWWRLSSSTSPSLWCRSG